MSGFDDDIDALYRLPLDAFTEARNQLAKRAGGEPGQLIRALAKPALAAWAVNQVFWRDRVAFDRLVKAAEATRVAHRRLVSGDESDVAGAEAAHADAVARATEVARAALDEARQAGSKAVLAAVADTLRALPSADPFGRLVRPLVPVSGFEAFAGLVPRGPRTGSEGRSSELRLQKGAGTATAARDLARDRVRVAKELAVATERLAAAQAALKSLTRAVESAKHERDRRQAALDESEARLNGLTGRLPRARQDVEDAVHEHDRLKRRVETPGS